MNEEKGGKKKCLFWNVAGLKNKENDFWQFIKEYDVVGLSETWVDDQAWEEMKNILPDEYTWKVTPAKKEHRVGRASGGIITGLKKDIEEENPQETGNDSMQIRKAKIDGKLWKFVTVYNRGGNPETLNRLEEMIDEAQEENLVLGGDFNARIGLEGSIEEEVEETERKRKSRDTHINREGRALVTLTRRRGWYVLNGNYDGDEEGQFTFIGHNSSTVIDYVIVNSDAREEVLRMEVEERTDSDHQPVTINIKCKETPQTRDAQTVKTREKQKEVYVWNETATENYKNLIDSRRWKQGTVEEETNEIVSALVEATTKRKISGRKRKTKEWWDKECHDAKKEMKKALRTGRKHGRTFQQYRVKKKKFRDLCRRKKREHSEKEEKEILNIKSEKEMWQYIGKGKKKRISPS